MRPFYEKALPVGATIHRRGEDPCVVAGCESRGTLGVWNGFEFVLACEMHADEVAETIREVQPQPQP
jgi:hypothetical protein